MRSVSAKRRRAGVVLNYLSLVLFLALFRAGLPGGWSVAKAAAIVAVLAVSVWSFVDVHVGTGLWRLAHAPHDRLDEREIQMTRDSLRYAYAVFSVVALIVMFVVAIFGIRGFGQLGVLVPAVLTYAAHTLPSSVIAWTEKTIAAEP